MSVAVISFPTGESGIFSQKFNDDGSKNGELVAESEVDDSEKSDVEVSVSGSDEVGIAFRQETTATTEGGVRLNRF